MKKQTKNHLHVLNQIKIFSLILCIQVKLIDDYRNLFSHLSIMRISSGLFKFPIFSISRISAHSLIIIRIIIIILVLITSKYGIYGQTYNPINLNLESYNIWGDISVSSWGDIDLDGDYDIIVTGRTMSIHNLIGVLLINDGNNNFSVGNSTSLFEYNINGVFGDPIHYGNIIFEDFDNDNKPEVFEAGTYLQDSWDNRLPHSLVKIWKKTETGGTLVFKRDVTGETITFAGCADYDNDGDMDFHINGLIYENKNGQYLRNYKLKSDFPSIIWSDDATNLDIADCDNDGDPDSLGLNVLYINQEGSSLYPKPSVPAPDHFEAFPERNLVNLYVNPSINPPNPNPKISYNLRVGNTPGGSQVCSPLSNLTNSKRYTPAIGNAGIEIWPIALKDLQPGGTYYWSIQAINEHNIASDFSSEKSFKYSRFQDNITDMAATPGGIRLPGDFNNDGHFEVLSASTKFKVENTYYNHNGIVNPITGSEITTFELNGWVYNTYGLANSAALSDLNNDGLIDIFISYQGEIPIVYVNSGNDAYLKTTLHIPGFSDSEVSPADFDNDGDNDLFITGNTAIGNKAYLILNNDNLNFNVFDSTKIEGVTSGCSAWGDYDNDNDPDLFISGITSSGGSYFQII